MPTCRTRRAGTTIRGLPRSISLKPPWKRYSTAAISDQFFNGEAKRELYFKDREPDYVIDEGRKNLRPASPLNRCGSISPRVMPQRIWALLFSTTLLFLAYAQVPNEQFRQRSLAAEKTGLAEPFRGVTANGTVQPGLFPLRSSGVSTEPARKGAAAFLAALSPAQRAKSLFPVDDLEWRKWMN